MDHLNDEQRFIVEKFAEVKVAKAKLNAEYSELERMLEMLHVEDAGNLAWYQTRTGRLFNYEGGKTGYFQVARQIVSQYLADFRSAGGSGNAQPVNADPPAAEALVQQEVRPPIPSAIPVQDPPAVEAPVQQQIPPPIEPEVQVQDATGHIIHTRDGSEFFVIDTHGEVWEVSKAFVKKLAVTGYVLDFASDLGTLFAEANYKGFKNTGKKGGSVAISGIPIEIDAEAEIFYDARQWNANVANMIHPRVVYFKIQKLPSGFVKILSASIDEFVRFDIKKKMRFVE